MAVTVIATPGADNANSYCTKAEAEAYHETRLHNSAWSAATDDSKNRALVTATRLLDDLIEWDGLPSYPETQALQWPRSGLYTPVGAVIEENQIPLALKNAVAEYAFRLLEADLVANASQDLESVSVGDISVAFASGGAQRKPIPDSVMEMIQFWVWEKKSDVSNPVTVLLERA